MAAESRRVIAETTDHARALSENLARQDFVIESQNPTEWTLRRARRRGDITVDHRHPISADGRSAGTVEPPVDVLAATDRSPGDLKTGRQSPVRSAHLGGHSLTTDLSGQTITCMDTTERLTVEQADAASTLFNQAAPRLAPDTIGRYFCTFFPESIDPRAEITGDGVGPIVVCGATNDPVTPLASSRNMVAALADGRLIVIDANQHTCYGASSCADDVIESYLADLEIPAKRPSVRPDDRPAPQVIACCV